MSLSYVFERKRGIKGKLKAWFFSISELQICLRLFQQLSHCLQVKAPSLGAAAQQAKERCPEEF